MIQQLSLNNVGPAPEMNLDFGERLNIITGDNGLGKSFLLDCIWWAMTRKWPAQINKKIGAGNMGLPSSAGKATISFVLDGKTKKSKTYQADFDRRQQAWIGAQGRPINPGLILYAMADGSFAIWDPARNYWKNSSSENSSSRPAAYVFNPQEIWNGLPADTEGNAWLCNGIIRDWASWQKENGEAWEQIKQVLKCLSPAQEPMEPGALTRINLDDVRDMPTIKMPYGTSVPLLHASSAMRRIIALAYCLVWAWQEHKKAAELLGEAVTRSVTFLIDEIEAHLHPQWQRQITAALVAVMNSLMNDASVQLIITTHAPLVMAACEDVFSQKTDRWFDIDMQDARVVLSQLTYQPRGTAECWLNSPAFDLSSTRAPQIAEIINQASHLLCMPSPDPAEIQRIDKFLVEKLSPEDKTLIRWRYICHQRNLLS